VPAAFEAYDLLDLLCKVEVTDMENGQCDATISPCFTSNILMWSCCCL